MHGSGTSHQSGRGLADAMEDERDEREPATAVLTRVDELGDLRAKLGRGAVLDQVASALQDVTPAQCVDLRLDFLDPSSKTRGKACAVQ